MTPKMVGWWDQLLFFFATLYMSTVHIISYNICVYIYMCIVSYPIPSYLIVPHILILSNSIWPICLPVNQTIYIIVFSNLSNPPTPSNPSNLSYLSNSIYPIYIIYLFYLIYHYPIHPIYLTYLIQSYPLLSCPIPFNPNLSYLSIYLYIYEHVWYGYVHNIIYIYVISWYLR